MTSHKLITTMTSQEEAVRCDKLLIILILGFWSWSTLQFTMVLTASKARRPRAVGIYDDDLELEEEDEEDDESGVSRTTSIPYELEDTKEPSLYYCFFINIYIQ